MWKYQERQVQKNIQMDMHLTKAELDMLNEYCEKINVTRSQGLRGGIKALKINETMSYGERDIVPLKSKLRISTLLVYKMYSKIASVF